MTAKETRKNNIDALLSGIPEAQPIIPANTPPKNTAKEPASVPKVDNKTDEVDNNSSEIDNQDTEKNQKTSEARQNDPLKVEKAPKNDEKSNSSSEKSAPSDETHTENDASLDEYGNPLPKPKMYTEEEVQKMIRDRLKRGQYKDQQPQQQPSPQQVKEAKDAGFEYDENSSETWSQQLKTFVKNTVKEMTQEDHQHREIQRQKQAEVEFESKMLQGMGNFNDFVEALDNKPITDAMMMGIRGLDNPAAFLYAAAKKHPQELERISKIADPYQQISEMGRLHERMVKRKSGSNGPRPLSRDHSDVNEKIPAKVAIEHLIEQDALARRRR